MSNEEYWIAEAEKKVNRMMVEKKIRASKEFFRSAIYRSIVWDEDDEVAWYEEDSLTY